MTYVEGPARFRYDGAKDVVVDFNPTSLDYTVTNTLKSGKGTRPAQIVSQASAKLTMELLFDSTNTGEDVRVRTRRVAMLMRPGGGEDGKEREPLPTVTFAWGWFKFVGYVDSFKEKIDFFSAEGVPLRSTVSLSMTQQDLVFEQVEGASKLNANIPLTSAVPFASPDVAKGADAGGGAASSLGAGASIGLGLDLGGPSSSAPSAPGGGDAAIASGDLGTAGLAPNATSAGLSSPTTAASGARGGSAVAGSAGANARASTTRSTSASPRVGGSSNAAGGDARPRANAGASAGVSAKEGAFSGLTRRTSPRTDPASDLARPMRAPLPDERGSGPEVGYRIGGQAMSLSAGSAVADVGQSVRLSERIRFDRDDGGGDR